MKESRAVVSLLMLTPCNVYIKELNFQGRHTYVLKEGQASNYVQYCTSIFLIIVI